MLACIILYIAMHDVRYLRLLRVIIYLITTPNIAIIIIDYSTVLVEPKQYPLDLAPKGTYGF